MNLMNTSLEYEIVGMISKLCLSHKFKFLLSAKFWSFLFMFDLIDNKLLHGPKLEGE